MEFRQFLRVLFRRRNRRLIWLMCLSAMVTATGLTYVLSEKYRASTTILIRPRKALDLVPKREEILSFPVSYYTPIAAAANTYAEITKSRAIAERVVGRLGLDIAKEPQGVGLTYRVKRWARQAKGTLIKTWDLLKYGRVEQADAFSHAVGEVQDGLTVKPTKDTYLFELEAEARTPNTAAAIANTAAEEFVAYLQELHRKEAEKARELSRVTLEESRQALDQARASLVDFKQADGVVSLPDEIVIELERMSDLEHSRTLTQRDISAAQAQLAEVDRQLAELEQFSRWSETRIDNPIARKLQLQLAEKEVRLAGLNEKYKPEHQEVQALQAEVDRLREQLQQLDPTIQSEETVTANPLYRSLLDEQATLTGQLEALRAKESKLAEPIEVGRRMLNRMPQQQAQLSRLELDVRLKEQMHVLLSKEIEELALAATRNTPDIEITDAAVPPLYPSRPIKVYHALLALALSLPTAVGVILLRERLQHRIRSVEEGEHALRCTVLMTVPRERRLARGCWPLVSEATRSLPEARRQSRRKYIRKQIAVGRQGQSSSIECETIDVSRDGVCFRPESGLFLEPDEHVEIKLDPGEHDSTAATVGGVVIRSEQSGPQEQPAVAVKFVNVSEEMGARIEQWLGADQPYAVSPAQPHFYEPIRGIRTDLGLLTDRRLAAFLITSCDRGDGKSTIAANLGRSLAALNRKVVLVDANLRHPSLHEVFQLDNKVGLLDALTGRSAPRLTKVSAGLSVLSSGERVSDPSAVLGCGKLPGLLESLKSEFDYVLIDSPGLLVGPDAALLASIADGVVLVVNVGETTIEQGQRARQILGRAKAELLGVVMNNYDSEFEPFYCTHRSHSTL